MKDIIGIDFGASYASVAIVENGQPKIVENNEGFRSTPMVVAFNREGQKLVGSAAKRQALMNPEMTFVSIRQLLGRKIGEAEVEDIAKRTGIKVVAVNGLEVGIQTPKGETLSPTAIAGHMFGKIREGAEGSLNKTISDAVVSVPAHYQEHQRHALKEAAKIAGIKVVKMIDEPVAAVLAYNVAPEETGEKVVFVYDFGGDSFDAAVIKMTKDRMEVKAYNHDTALGGDDIDEIVNKHFLDEFRLQTKVDLKNDTAAMQRVLEAAEKSKIELSTLVQSDVNLPYLTADATGPHHFSYVLKRSKLESLIDEMLKKTISRCEECLKKAGIEKSQVDEILLAGGICKMPVVRATIERFFNKPTNKAINPDEAIAIGAAIEAGSLKLTADNIVLLDSTPLSIGIETVGGLLTTIVEKGAVIPLRRKFLISTASVKQPSITLGFYAGERPLAKDNILLGQFQVQGLYPDEKAKSEIEVVFEITEDGTMKIKTTDTLTGNEQSFSASGSLGLNPSEVDQIIANAQTHKTKDEAAVAQIQERIDLDELTERARQSLKLLTDLSETEALSAQEAIERALSAVKQGHWEHYASSRSALTALIKRSELAAANSQTNNEAKQ